MEVLFYILKYLPVLSNMAWILVPGGSYEVLKLGRSKNGYKKFKKTLTIKDRIFKLRYVSLSKRAVKFQYYFVIMTYLGYLCILALLIMWIVSLFTHNFEEMFLIFLYVKCYTFELPAFVFTCLNIGRDKYGRGLDWTFIREYS